MTGVLSEWGVVLVCADGRVRDGAAVVRGTLVVHTPSPCAMVASRCTWRAEQPGEDLGLGLAQLRELLGHVGDRAVVLADLLALVRAVRRGLGRGSVAVGVSALARASGRSCSGSPARAGA